MRSVLFTHHRSSLNETLGLFLVVFNFSGFLYEVKVIMVLFLCILATKARSLKEDWIAYICREVLNVRNVITFPSFRFLLLLFSIRPLLCRSLFSVVLFSSMIMRNVVFYIMFRITPYTKRYRVWVYVFYLRQFSFDW